MKKLAAVALCFVSLFSNANEPEEVVVKARQVKIVLECLSKNHKQHPITGHWYYVKKEEKKKKA